MDSIAEGAGVIAYLLIVALVACVPLFLLVWFMKVLSDIRTGQRKIVQIMAAIHNDMREQAAREVWKQSKR